MFRISRLGGLEEDVRELRRLTTVGVQLKAVLGVSNRRVVPVPISQTFGTAYVEDGAKLTR